MRGVLVGVAVLLMIAFGGLLLLGSGIVGGPPTATPTGTPPLTSPTPTPSPVPPTPTASPRPTPIDTSIRASAIVVPRRSAELAMPGSGRVVAVPVEEEETVFSGEVLVRLDPTSRQAAVDVAAAEVARAETAVERARLQLEQLPEDASPAEQESAEADLRLAEAELDLARRTLDEAEIALRQTELRAPFGGTVAWIGVTVGDQVVADQPIVAIGDLSSWFIQTTDLSELDVVRIAVGDRAEVTVHALPDLEIRGTVERVQVRGTAQDGGVNFDVVIMPDEHHRELRWNMSASVRILPRR